MNVGIVGAGAIARRAHLPAYGTLPEVQVAGIADSNLALAKKVAEEFKIPRYYNSGEELLQDNSIDVVDICTPTPSHLDVVRMAAGKGRHVLVEKPLAASMKDALEIRSIVARNNVKLCVVQNWRYFPSVAAAKERITNGYLGKLVTIHALGLTPFPTHWTLGTWLYHEGGALYDFGPHVVDMVLWMKDFSPLKSVYASGGDFLGGSAPFTNYAVINMEFADGTVATADISWVTAMSLKFTLDMYGTGGSIFLDVRNDVSSETRGFPTPFNDSAFFLSKMWRLGTGMINGNFFKGANLGYKPLISSFADSIHGKGEVPVPIDHAVMTNFVLQAAQESIRQRRPIGVEEMTEASPARSA